jgi:hypothetical protein
VCGVRPLAEARAPSVPVNLVHVQSAEPLGVAVQASTTLAHSSSLLLSTLLGREASIKPLLSLHGVGDASTRRRDAVHHAQFDTISHIWHGLRASPENLDRCGIRRNSEAAALQPIGKVLAEADGGALARGEADSLHALVALNEGLDWRRRWILDCRVQRAFALAGFEDIPQRIAGAVQPAHCLVVLYGLSVQEMLCNRWHHISVGPRVAVKTAPKAQCVANYVPEGIRIAAKVPPVVERPNTWLCAQDKSVWINNFVHTCSKGADPIASTRVNGRDPCTW